MLIASAPANTHDVSPAVSKRELALTSGGKCQFMHCEEPRAASNIRALVGCRHRTASASIQLRDDCVYLLHDHRRNKACPCTRRRGKCRAKGQLTCVRNVGTATIGIKDRVGRLRGAVGCLELGGPRFESIRRRHRSSFGTWHHLFPNVASTILVISSLCRYFLAAPLPLALSRQLDTENQVTHTRQTSELDGIH